MFFGDVIGPTVTVTLGKTVHYYVFLQGTHQIGVGPDYQLAFLQDLSCSYSFSWEPVWNLNNCELPLKCKCIWEPGKPSVQLHCQLILAIPKACHALLTACPVCPSFSILWSATLSFHLFITPLAHVLCVPSLGLFLHLSTRLGQGLFLDFPSSLHMPAHNRYNVPL